MCVEEAPLHGVGVDEGVRELVVEAVVARPVEDRALVGAFIRVGLPEQSSMRKSLSGELAW
jgi:hypothetical protein